MKKIAIAGAALGGLFLLSACGSADQASTATSSAAAPASSAAAPASSAASAAPASSAAAAGIEVKTIGVSNLGLSFPFTAAISKGIQAAADAKGVTIDLLDAQGKADQQAKDVQDFITQKPDGVLLLPLDSGVATGLVDQLAAAGIPTVAVASQVGDPKTRELSDVYPGLVALVTQAETDAGAKAGEMALAALPEGGKMAIVEGSAGFAENTTRVQDFNKASDAAGVKWDVVASQPGDWVPDKAETACQNMLAGNPDIQLFYALSDDMAVGCAKAVKAAGKDAVVIGIGGSKLGIDAVSNDEIYGTVCYKPEDMGALAFGTIYDYLSTGQAPAEKFITYDTPAITKANVGDCTPQW